MSGLERDTLFLACTRPAMKWGVPMEGFYINSIGTLFFGMIMGSPLYWLIAPIVHLPMIGLANANPNFFRELRVWQRTKGKLVGSTLWALSPRPRNAREMASSV